MPAVEFLNVTRHFDEVRAVDDLSFTIDPGEFFSLLGPSGSGKTTCLRLIAGFDQPTSGSIRLSGREAAQLPPYDRDVNTVFQDYALFPHMSVGQNVGYSLMLKKVPKAERDRRVMEMLDLVQLGNLVDRRPSQLSGGQRQRVALARALINQPKVLLLDEPLGALDLKLRQQMQTELKAIQQRLGITFIYVTHDQEEALTMSDRMAVFNLGKIEQVGSPIEIYEHPKTPFVANFVGVSNLIQGSLAERLTGSPQPIALRPEKIQLHSIDAEDGVIGKIQELLYLGMYTRYRVQLDPAGELIVVEQNLTTPRFQTGDRVRLTWQSQHISPVAS
ncbi:ABC transporter ATP-binding protein [Microcoleus sp. FACHB-1515]|uniref:ATP-binding cassette domain-containing protein n=1 Tax=Leptolyngbya sp. FACHB-1515 TaxID=2933931 RepID=UPI001685333C|nr:ABC transporter ATP-binding protein [Microcoleus sp. FACHB-1515]